MSLKDGQWMFNTYAGSEFWQSDSFDTKEEAIRAGLEYYFDTECEQDYYEVGQIGLHVPHINIDWLIDNLRDDAYEQSGEAADSWLDKVPKDKQEELSNRMNEVLLNWLQEVNEIPSFGTMKYLEEIKVDKN